MIHTQLVYRVMQECKLIYALQPVQTLYSIFHSGELEDPVIRNLGPKMSLWASRGYSTYHYVIRCI